MTETLQEEWAPRYFIVETDEQMIAKVKSTILLNFVQRTQNDVEVFQPPRGWNQCAILDGLEKRIDPYLKAWERIPPMIFQGLAVSREGQEFTSKGEWENTDGIVHTKNYHRLGLKPRIILMHGLTYVPKEVMYSNGILGQIDLGKIDKLPKNLDLVTLICSMYEEKEEFEQSNRPSVRKYLNDVGVWLGL